MKRKLKLRVWATPDSATSNVSCPAAESSVSGHPLGKIIWAIRQGLGDAACTKAKDCKALGNRFIHSIPFPFRASHNSQIEARLFQQFARPCCRRCEVPNVGADCLVPVPCLHGKHHATGPSAVCGYSVLMCPSMSSQLSGE